MNEVDYKVYKKLFEHHSINESIIPDGVLDSNEFLGLMDSEILKKENAGRGFKIIVNDMNNFKLFFSKSFPHEIQIQTRADNIRMFRNSKSKIIKLPPVFFFRGFHSVQINNQLIDLKHYTNTYGLFTSSNTNIKADKICFVENLETFLNAEKILGYNYLFIHRYGRIGEESIKDFSANEVLVFVDYDFNGLNEYLNIKKKFAQAVMYIPEKYDVFFSIYSQPLGEKKAKMSRQVKESTLPEIIKIREQVSTTNFFLEQEFLFDDKI